MEQTVFSEHKHITNKSYMTLKCCNDSKPCNETIIFHNQQQFEQMQDHKGRHIHYRFDGLFLYSTRKLHQSNNSKIRIFCHLCSSQLKKCTFKGVIKKR